MMRAHRTYRTHRTHRKTQNVIFFKGKVQPGQKVLINGAGGGSGSFAVQPAKCFDAEVTGVDGTEKLDMMRSIGADHVIDYTQEDFIRRR